MKQLHFIGKQKKPAIFSKTLPEAQKALLAAGFRCQICYSSRSLKPYSRLGADLGTSPGDVLILCESCHEFADAQLRKRRYSKLARILHLTCIIILSAILMFLFEVLLTLLSQPLLWLCMIGLYMVLLLIALFSRWF